MRIADCGLRISGRRVAGALAALLLAPALLRAQSPAIQANAVADAKSITLAGTVHVTLTLEGPAPLRVELPKQLLTADANGAWRIRPEGPAAVKPVGNGREEWRRVYRLDPWAEGSPLMVSFNPVKVNGQEVTWTAVPVTVTKTVGEANATAARPVTPLEDVQPPPPPPASDTVPVWVVVVVALGCVAVLGLAWSRRRKAKPVPPGEWALAALAKLEAAPGGAEVVERVAAILRTFVERKFAIPATKLTTTELSAATAEQGWPVENAEPLRALLDECDRAKFAGDVPDDDGCRRLVQLAVDWVNHISQPPEPK